MDLSKVLDELGVLRVLIEALQQSVNQSTSFQQDMAKALEELASKPTTPPTIAWPTYRSDRLPVIGTITLRPQP